MRKLVMFGAVALALSLWAAEQVSAHGRCGGHGRCGHHGCGGGYCGGGGCAGGVCGVMPHHAFYDGESPGMLIVNLPADARLTFDGVATTSTSAQRTFRTPPLQTGQDYTYTLRAEVNRDGVTSEVTQVVTVRAGETTRISLEIPATGVAAR
jgi:uncharacterized protein (TIGR03000 family)